MRSIRSSLLFKVLILAIGVSAASVIPAYAQSAGGKFTLPHETRWGNILMSPGDYTFSLQSPGLPAPVMVSKIGSSQVAIVLPQGVSAEKLTDDSRLVLRHSDSGESFVSALYLGDIGLSLHYAPPKAQTPASETAKLGPIPGSQPVK